MPSWAPPAPGTSGPASGPMPPGRATCGACASWRMRWPQWPTSATPWPTRTRRGGPGRRGHARPPLTFDVLLRTLEILGSRVTYVRTSADVDDKIVFRAAEVGVSPAEL